MMTILSVAYQTIRVSQQSRNPGHLRLSANKKQKPANIVLARAWRYVGRLCCVGLNNQVNPMFPWIRYSLLYDADDDV